MSQEKCNAFFKISSAFLQKNGPFARWNHLLLRQESFRVFLSCTYYGFCHLNLAGITKFKYEKKNEKDSGRSGKMTPSCKWPISLKSYSHNGHMYFFLYFFSLYTRIEKNLNWSRYSFRYYKNFAFVIWIQYNTLDQEI